MLQGGCDDIGGTLMEETISRMAGSEHGSRKSVEELEALAAAAGRPSRQRTTGYGEVTAERHAAARRVLLPLEPTASPVTLRDRQSGINSLRGVDATLLTRV